MNVMSIPRNKYVQIKKNMLSMSLNVLMISYNQTKLYLILEKISQKTMNISQTKNLRQKCNYNNFLRMHQVLQEYNP